MTKQAQAAAHLREAERSLKAVDHAIDEVVDPRLARRHLDTATDRLGRLRAALEAWEKTA